MTEETRDDFHFLSLFFYMDGGTQDLVMQTILPEALAGKDPAEVKNRYNSNVINDCCPLHWEHCITVGWEYIHQCLNEENHPPSINLYWLYQSHWKPCFGLGCT